jgi:TonB family protein
LLSEADFVAEPVERLDAPEPPTPAERRRHVLALIAAALFHLLIPLSFLLYYWLWPRMIPTAVQEIPVEVVVEQPPPPPKPKPPEEKPKPQPDLEKPAYDAPAAPTKEKVNRESPDKTTEAKASPEAPPPPNPGAPPKAETPAPEPKPADQEKGQTAPPAHDLTPEPEGELPADANPPKPEDNPAQAAAPAAPLTPPNKARVGTPIPTIEDLPQYKFARSVEDSPVAGGNAESRYLTIVYGKIKEHLHESPDLRLDLANRHGMVDFYVDEGGNLIGRKLVASSGSANLDIAVMAAIAEAAPYPAPPHWSPISLNYNFGRTPTAGSAGAH